MCGFISGEPGAMVSSTLKLGISILNGGNSDVQQVLKKDNVQVLCTVLISQQYDLNLCGRFLLTRKSSCLCAENAGLSEG